MTAKLGRNSGNARSCLHDDAHGHSEKYQLIPAAAYYHDKSTVIQEARAFNESPISPRKCRALLTRIVYLLYVGETFSTQEATTLFFGVTKLFQHKDVSWHR